MTLCKKAYYVTIYKNWEKAEMDMKNYYHITKEESKKCERIVDIFDELLDKTDTTVINTGKYGFVLLKCFDYDGFYNITTYRKSEFLFEDLWEEWLEEKLISLCINTPLINLTYKDMFAGQSIKIQNEILNTKKSFLSSIYTENVKKKLSLQKSYITATERENCRIIADIFKKDLEKDDIIIEETRKFGFIMLQYFEPKKDFDSAIVFKNCQEMFDILLEEWFTYQISELMEQKNVTDIDIDDFYNELLKEEKEELRKRKANFVKQALKKADFIKY